MGFVGLVSWYVRIGSCYFLKLVKSDKCDIKYKVLYRKVKKKLYFSEFFIWIIIKNYWCNIKNEKMCKCFDVNYY
jgi:hypothetical protein